MTETDVRKHIVQTMVGWYGAETGSTVHAHIIDVYNSYTPHPRGYAMTKKDPWCAATVSAAAIAAGYTDIIPVECSCNELIKKFQAWGRWVENDAFVPALGDFIFYDWDDKGKGDNVGQVEHVGLVTNVTDNVIVVIEGNRGQKSGASRVGYRQIQVNGQFIRGFGTPDYKSKATTKSPNEITIQNAVDDGVITSPDFWLSVLDGAATPPASFVKALIDKYHDRLNMVNKDV